MPNSSADKKTYWVPAGLLSGETNTKVSAHVYASSSADWDVGFTTDHLPKFEDMPTPQEWDVINKKDKQ